MKPMPPGYQATIPLPGTGPLGEPGERDPDAPCEGYQPGIPGHGDCESDGHYLCYTDPGCVHFRAKETP